MSAIRYAAGSFRDRSARVFCEGDRIFRALDFDAAQAWKAVEQTNFWRSITERREVVESREIPVNELQDAPEWAALVLEHERIPFVSYPYEWSFDMLQQAALLQLSLLRRGLGESITLKDATPYNIMFDGVTPRLIDIASLVPAVSGAPWYGYRQFCELFLIPLLLQAHRRIDFQPVLKSHLDGLPAREARSWFSWRDLWRPGVFTHVWMHGKLQDLATRSPSATAQTVRNSSWSTQQLDRTFAGLAAIVDGLRWNPPKTAWTAYTSDFSHVELDRQAKAQFVDESMRQRRSLVWDLGCNTGAFSRLAARRAEYVVAMDGDPACVEELFRNLSTEGIRNVLPLVVNLANPSPGLGWGGRERVRLEERGKPDLVLCLGLIHHLVIACNIRLEDVVEWLAGLGGDVLIEFPAKTDPMVRQLLAGRPDQYSDYSIEQLFQALKKHFVVSRQTALPSGHRTLVFAERRPVNGRTERATPVFEHHRPEIAPGITGVRAR